ncbi:MAG: hypothetical protein ACI88H_004053, partial [Cocleimonas sp.]
PPSHPVTSVTSPIKYKPLDFLASKVLEDSSSVSTPPNVTSAEFQSSSEIIKNKSHQKEGEYYQ